MTFSINRDSNNQITQKVINPNPFDLVPTNNMSQDSAIHEESYLITSPTINTFVLDSNSVANTAYRSWWVKINDEIIEIDSYDSNTKTITLKYNFGVIPSAGDTAYLYNLVSASFMLNETDKTIAAVYKKGKNSINNLSAKLDDINFQCRKIKSLDTTKSTSPTTGAVLTAGGIASSCIEDSTDIDNGGSLTLAGGAAIKKKLYVGSLNIDGVDITPSELDNFQYLDAINVTPGTATASKALILDANKDISGIRNLETENLTVNGTLITATATELNFTDTTAGTAQASKALVVDVNRDITNIHNLTATNLTGTLQTGDQSHITNVGTLTSLSTGNITLNGTLITSTAGELNYNHLTTGPGTAEASKAVVLDSSRDITNIHNLTATNLTGTLQTADQSHITSVGTLTSLSVGNITSSGDITATNLTGTLQTADQSHITNVGTLTSLSTGDITLNGTLITSTAAELNYNDLTTGPGTAEASKAVVLNSTRDITNIHNLTATTVTATDLNGTLQTADQSHITNVGTLTSLSTGDITLNGTLITSTAAELNYNDLTTGPGTAEASKTVVLDSSRDITNIHNLTATTVTATDLNGTLQTADQSHITNVGTLTSLSTGDITLNGTLITASAAKLNYNDITTLGTAQINKVVTTNASNDVTGINNLTATKLTGAIQTASQTLITSVGTLTSLSTGNITLNGTEITSTAGELNYNHLTTGPGTAEASKAVVLDSNKDITSVRNLTATTLNGTNVNTTNTTTTNLSTTNFTLNAGTVSSTAEELNYNHLTTGPGTAEASKALVLNSSRNITNINNLTATGAITASDLKITNILMSNVLVNTTAPELNYNHLTTGPGTAEASKALVLNSSKDISSINSLTSTSLIATNLTTTNFTLGGTSVTSTAAELNYNDLTTGPGTAEASKALVLDANKDIVSIRNATVTGLTTTNFTLGGTAVTSTAAELNYNDLTTGPGTAEASKALVLNSSKNITGINNLSTTGNVTLGSSVTGGVCVGTSTDTNRMISCLNSGLSAGSANYITLGQANSAKNQAELYFKYVGSGNGDNNFNISFYGNSIPSVSASANGKVGINIAAPLTTDKYFCDIQGNTNIRGHTFNSYGIHSFGYDSGTSTTLDGMGPGAHIHFGASTAQFFGYSYNTTGGGGYYDTSIGPGNAFVVKADSKIGIGTASPVCQLHVNGGSTMPSSISGVVTSWNYKPYNYSGVQGGSGTTPDNTSIFATGRVITCGEFDVQSDRRTKENITLIRDDYCLNFVKDINSVAYNFKKTPEKPEFGYIAQDIIHKGYGAALVHMNINEEMEASIDEETGYENPEGVQFTVTYDKVIPILHNVLKVTLQRVENLEKEKEEQKQLLSSMADKLALLEEKLNKL